MGIGEMTYRTALGLIRCLMGLSIKVCSKMARNVDLASLFGPMVPSTPVNGPIIRYKDMVFTSGLMAVYTKDNF